MSCDTNKKVNYIPKYCDDINLVIEFSSNRDEWIKHIKERYNYPDLIINAIQVDESGRYFLPDSFSIREESIKPKSASMTLAEAASFYIKKGNFNGFDNLKKKFARNIVEATIFKVYQDEDGNFKTESVKRIKKDKDLGVDTLNKNIFSLKMSLAKTLLDFVGNDSLDTSEYSNDDSMQYIINIALNQFESFKNENASGYQDALDAFIMLKAFDSLLADSVDFIESNNVKGRHTLDQYTYTGAKSIHLNNYSDESADINKTTSKLQKIILSYLPTIEDGKLNFNHSVEGNSGGFDEVVIAFKDYIDTLPFNDNLRKQFLNRNISNLYNAFTRFIESYKLAKNNNEYNYGQRIIERAESIKEFIFNPKSNLSSEYKNMFKAQLYKTAKNNYTYYTTEQNGETKANVLGTRVFNMQSAILQNAVSASRRTYKNNKKLFEEKKAKWDIKIGFDTISINSNRFKSPIIMKFEKYLHVNEDSKKLIRNIEISRKDNKENWSSSDYANDNKAAFDFISDILYFSIPEDYKKNLKNLGINSDLFGIFAKPIALLIAGSDKGFYKTFFQNKEDPENAFNTKMYSEFFRSATDFMSYVYGAETITMLKNQSKNNVPIASLISMGNQFPELVNSIEERAADTDNNINSNNPCVIALHKNNSSSRNALLQDSIRLDVSTNIDSTVKESKKLNTAELANISIIDDFLNILLGKNNISEDKVLNFMYYVMSDKTTHPLLRVNVNKFSATLKLTYFNILQNICKYDTDKYGALKSEDIIRKNILFYRQDRINKQVDKIVKSYFTICKDELSQIIRQRNKNISEEQIDKMNNHEKIMVIDEYLKSLSKDELYNLQKKFIDNGEDFIENIHYSKLRDKSHYVKEGAKYGFNETIFRYYTVFNNDELFKERIAKQLFEFVLGLSQGDVQLPVSQCSKACNELGTNFLSKWGGKYWETSNLKHYKLTDSSKHEVNIETISLGDSSKFTFNQDGTIKFNDEKNNVYILDINPILKSQFYAYNFFARSYALVKFGDPFNHDTKYTATDNDYNEDGTKKDRYYTHNEASRSGAALKRSVGNGATCHVFQFDEMFGPSRYINVSCMEDVPGTAWNLIGNQITDLDSMDGSGFVSPYEASMEQWSLHDAASKTLDTKTIFGDIDPEFGGQRLIKWAVYAITNNRRRLSDGSNIRFQKLFEKMHSTHTLDLSDIDLSSYYKIDGTPNIQDGHNLTCTTPLYFKDKDGKYGDVDAHYKIVSISNDGNTVTRKLQKVKSNGKAISNTFDVIDEISTLVDLDRVFGGAYTEEFNSDNNALEYSERNNEIISYIICKNNIKNQFIGYLVNKSAFKVGAANINSVNSWTDDSKLNTFKISLQFGGVLMDAGHDLDNTEVTEMSQMISALTQNGYSTDLVDNIYSDIGEVAVEGVREFKENIEFVNKDKVYRLMGKALMETFNEKSSTNLGLARSFITKAAQYINEEKIEYKLPFSAKTINGSFIANIIANINKSGIRRKYFGIPNYLVPSNDIIQYYRINNNIYTYDELARVISTDNRNVRGWSVKDCLSKIVNESKEINPFLIKVTSRNNIDIEDTIVVYDTVKNEYSAPIKIDNWYKYDEYRNLYNSKDKILYNWVIRPKNLRQENFLFDCTLVGQNYTQRISQYDLDTCRADYYLSELKDVTKFKLSDFDDNKLKKLALLNALIISGISIDENKSYNIKTIQNIFRKKTQDILNDIRNNKHIKNQSCLLDKQDIYNNKIEDSLDLLSYDIELSNLQYISPEAIMGKIHSKELGLTKHDTLNDIMSKGSKFFEKGIRERLSKPHNIDKDNYDLILISDDGKKTLVTFSNNDTDVLDKYKDGNNVYSNSEYYTLDGKYYHNNDIISNSDEGMSFYRIVPNNGDEYDIMILKDPKKLNEILKDSTYYSNDIIYNYRYDNWKDIFLFKYADNIVIEDGKYKTRESEDFEITFSDGEKNYFIKGDLDNIIPPKRRGEILSLVKKMTESNKHRKFNSEEEKQQYINDVYNNYIRDEIKKTLNDSSKYENEEKIERLSKSRFNAFKSQLNLIGARIPTQNQQSFMPLKIIAFSDSQYNEIYIPKSQTWLQGSDYDIDKEYCMGYALNDDGTLQTLSKLQNVLGPELALKLVSPNGKKYVKRDHIHNVIERMRESESLGEVIIDDNVSIEVGEYENVNVFLSDNAEQSILVHFEGIQDGYNVYNFIESNNLSNKSRKILYKYASDVLSIDDILILPDTERKKELLIDSGFKLSPTDEYLTKASWASGINSYELNNAIKDNYDNVDLLNKILKSGNTSISFAPDVEDNVKVKKLLRMLNMHSSSKNWLRGKRLENALRNRVVSGILEVIKNPSNRIISTTPVVMDIPRKAAESSELGKQEQELLLDNPYMNTIMQIQNMGGKDVIGITAVMLKVFFGASFNSNLKINEAADLIDNGDNIKALSHLNNIIFSIINIDELLTSPNSKSINYKTLANLNFEALKKVIPEDGILHINRNKVEIGEMYSNISGWLEYVDENECTFNIGKFINDLESTSSKVDAADEISQLLSAATDNAKELILSKINATSLFTDIYGYLITSGYSIKKISDFMQSKIMNVISRFGQSNMRDPICTNVSIKNIIDFILGDSYYGKVDKYELNKILFSWWYDDKKEISDDSFLPKLVYKIDKDGRIIKRNGEPELRSDLIKLDNIDDGNGNLVTITVDKDFLRTFFETAEVDDGKYALTDKAKSYRNLLKKILYNNDAVDILIKHLHYLKSKTNENSNTHDNQGFGNDFDDWFFEEDNPDQYSNPDDIGQALLDEQDEYNWFDNEENKRVKKYNKKYDPTKIKSGELRPSNYDVFIKYFDYYTKKRNDLLNQIPDLQKELDKLNILRSSILPGLEEQSILGAMLGVNQGLPTNSYDLYSLITRIENFITSRTFKTEHEKFDLMKFIDNEDYRRKYINVYEKVKNRINVLDVITTVPHFSKMFDMISLANKLLSQSARNRLEQSFANIKTYLDKNKNDSKYLPMSKLSKQEFAVVQNYISQLLVLSWIRNKNIKFYVPEGRSFYNSHNKKYVAIKEGKDINLNNKDNVIDGNALASFVNWMNEYVIPNLRSKYNKNRFVTNIVLNSAPLRNGRSANVFRFPFNPMDTDNNPVSKTKWDSIVKDFDDISQLELNDFCPELKDKSGGNMKFMDALYLYTLIIFGDGFNQNSLIKVFEDVNLKHNDSFVNDFNVWLSKLDSDELQAEEEIRGYNIVDLINLIGTVPSGSKNFKVIKNNNGYTFETFDEKGEKISIDTNISELSDDYTINLYNQLNLVESHDRRNSIEAYSNKFRLPKTRYAINDMNVIDGIANMLKERYSNAMSSSSVHIITTSDIRDAYNKTTKSNVNIIFEDGEKGEKEFNRMMYAKAFINNGNIYLVKDNADIGSLFHEYMHIAAAILKFNDDENVRKSYYALCDKAYKYWEEKNDEEYARLKSDYEGLQASDYKEELLVKWLEDSFIKKLKDPISRETSIKLDKVLSEGLTKVLGVPSTSKINIDPHIAANSSIRDILRLFNSVLISLNTSNVGYDSIYLSEKLRAVKQKLIDSKEIRFENCK